jgi:protein-S-isoprenylcysteine O-methyltransferase Ste14
MDWGVRAYLLMGLVGHKVLWEVWKRRSGPPHAATSAASLPVRAVKLGKKLFLGGIIVQVLMPAEWSPVPPLTVPPAPTLIALGLAVFTGGLLLAVVGRVQLGANWADIESAAVLGRQRLVAHGVYRFIRHPIYVGDLLLLIGLELALNSSVFWLIMLLVPVVLRQAVKEEALLAAELDGYPGYCARTKRFVPFLI